MDRRVPDIKEITENEKDGHPYLGVRHLLMMGKEGKGPGEGKCAKWPESAGGAKQLWTLVFWVKLARLMHPVIWSNANPDVAVKASADVMSITISRL